MLYIAVGTSPDQVINGQLLQEFRLRLRRLEQGFREIHPDTNFRFSLYPEDTLIAAMSRRQWSGLEPDLLFVTARTAHRLLEAGITTPFPVKAEMRNRFEPAFVRLLSSGTEELAGLPTLQQLQISCFDTHRLPQAPTNTDALLATSAREVPIGLSVQNDSLLWTVGSLGALPALLRVMRGEPPRAADHDALKRWLTWLATASSQQRVTFYGNQDQAEEALSTGQLAWIPCRSTTLPRLKRAMGNRLGVAPLPDGVTSAASPINPIRVLALGRNSTPRARQAAIAFSEFTVNALVQRAITLGSYTVLPVNRHVSIPVSSSQTLATLVRARDQGLQSDQLLPLVQPNDQRSTRLHGLITELVFGEVSAEAATSRLIAILQQLR